MVQTRNRSDFLPYGRQNVDDDDIKAVVKVLKSDRLTQGPTIDLFEEALKKKLSAEYVVVCANGTAALHLTMLALGMKDGDIVVTTPVTFMASANCARFVGASVKFVDVEPDTALISPDELEKVILADKEKKIKAVVAVHLTGHPVNLPEIYRLCKENNLAFIDDCCHALGAWFEHDSQRFLVGGNDFSVMSAFSFHPVKHIATGEGGAVSTSNKELAEKLRRFRNHGINRETFINKDMAYSQSGEVNPWYHEMQELCPNYRMNDIQAALGISQLKKLDYSLKRRNEIACYYSGKIKDLFAPDEVRPLKQSDAVFNAYHLYVLQIDFKKFNISRAEVMNRLRENNIGTQVHYIPLHLQPYYRDLLKTGPGDFPHAERYYERALSIPIYPQLTDGDCDRVIDELKKILYRD